MKYDDELNMWPSIEEMEQTCEIANRHPNNFKLHSQVAMVNRYNYLLGRNKVLDPTLHSESQIKM